MASISDFMKEHINDISEIIDKELLGDSFDSHYFIRRFSHKYQTEYVKMLALYPDQPFMYVHSQIATFLLEHRTELHITKVRKVSSPNIFGNDTENELWQKTTT